MIKKQQITKKQHTIPKCYFKTFGNYFFVYIKEKNKWVENCKYDEISKNKYYYEHPKYEKNEIEKYLSLIENEWSKNGRDRLLDNLNNDKNYELTEYDKTITSKFIWCLINRTPHFFSRNNEMHELLGDYLKNNNATKELIDEHSHISTKEVVLDSIKNDIGGIKFLNDFHWIVLKSCDSMHKFFISDNPIIRDGEYSYKNYIINFILSPTILIQLISKNNIKIPNKKNRNRIKNIKYKDIIYYNKCQIRDSYKYIYVLNKQQQQFVNNKIKLFNSNVSMKIKELNVVGESNSLLLSFDFNKQKIIR
jgi:hypothetical protein